MAEELGRTARKRKQIMEAATAVFLNNGYQGASMDEVAALASVSKQTVYKQFGDKEQLFRLIVLETTHAVDGVIDLVSASLADTTSLERDLSELASSLVTTLMNPQILRLRRLIIAEADRFPDVSRSWYDQGFQRVLATIASRFEGLAARGLLVAPDPLLAANHFAGLLLWIPVNHVMFYGGDSPYTESDLATMATTATRTFLAAYMPR